MDTIEKMQTFVALREAECLPIRGKFHAHLTLQIGEEEFESCRQFCRNQRVKLTVVNLEGLEGRQQTEVMLTSHYQDDESAAVFRIANQLCELSRSAIAAGYPVVRAKLEHESLPTFAVFSQHRYHEIHIKLKIPTANFDKAYRRLKSLGSRLQFVPSRNPLQKRDDFVLQFVNLRIYEGTYVSAESRLKLVLSSLDAEGFEIRETKRETVVFDTSHKLDAWWA